ncbi:hypothetical protein [Aureimonas mangrovi]|uniref:hypothetical protein n=1 Tax=Aureimonas mangrovi TaxID=2758041 RepID=UPI001AED2BC0|nr:hypothetical protein [Aureimonas mangrovi]
MTVERLVQEHGIERTDIFIAPVSAQNSAGVKSAGADREAGEPSVEGRADTASNGPIEVSVEIADEQAATTIRDAFSEFDAHDVNQS